MRKIFFTLGLLMLSSSAFAWEDASPPGLCTRVNFVNQTYDYLVLNGQVRVRKSHTNTDYLTTALQDPSLIVCLGTETDIWGNVDVVSIGRPGQQVPVITKY